MNKVNIPLTEDGLYLCEAVLEESVKREMALEENLYCEEDAQLFLGLRAQLLHYKYRIFYFAQLIGMEIPEITPWVLKYISHFRSHVTRSLLLSHLFSSDETDSEERSDCIFSLFEDFRRDRLRGLVRQEDIRAISYRFDLCFTRLADRLRTYRLIPYLRDPSEAVFLPKTLAMLSSWECEECRQILLTHLYAESYPGINAEDITRLRLDCLIALSEIKSDLGVKVLKDHLNDSDPQIRCFARVRYPDANRLEKRRQRWRNRKKRESGD